MEYKSNTVSKTIHNLIALNGDYTIYNFHFTCKYNIHIYLNLPFSLLNPYAISIIIIGIYNTKNYGLLKSMKASI